MATRFFVSSLAFVFESKILKNRMGHCMGASSRSVVRGLDLLSFANTRPDKME
jgi:hypothetical protein